MRKPDLSLRHPDPALLSSLALAKRICLGAVVVIAFFDLCEWFIPALAPLAPTGWKLMNANSALCAVLGAISLDLSEYSHSRRTRAVSLILAALVTLLAAALLFEHRFHISFRIDILLAHDPRSRFEYSGKMSTQSAVGFLLLGIAIILIQSRKRIAIHLADLFVFSLGLLVMIAVSEYLFGALPIFGLPGSIRTSPITLLCLFLLAQVAVFRSAEDGVFSILLGRGIGSRIARLFSPILLILPFLREAGRMHILQSDRLPANYAIAILASLAAMLSFALLLVVAWRINGMEKEIHNLSLRDELTGLYNLRGFHLLGEQALRLARRSQAPFSVLFIDLDNLKQINDLHGHSVGSAMLIETAELLRATFRETDVLGRIGGDEFSVAGQFSHAAIAVATQRLREACVLRNSESGHRFSLSLSIGHVTSGANEQESLRALLSDADDAMYQEKRRKKSLLA